MRLLIILGTRPEIIKMAPVIYAARASDRIEIAIAHTGQHYDPNLDKIFFQDLELSAARYQNSVVGLSYAQQLNAMVNGIRRAIQDFNPQVILVQGDTTSVLAGALAGVVERVAVAHHEAGLRCGNLAMLEEGHRIIVDSVADFLYAPTTRAMINLQQEKVTGDCLLTGNTIIDAVRKFSVVAEKRSNILSKQGLVTGQYILLTFHRRENIENAERLATFLTALTQVAKMTPKQKIIFPIHPYTARKLADKNFIWPDNVVTTTPVGFFDMLQLEQHAAFIMTDSGGIQEEACALRVPCLTLRDETERPETLVGGMNELVGVDPDKILVAASVLRSGKQIIWSDPFGDGTAGQKIIVDLLARVD